MRRNGLNDYLSALLAIGLAVWLPVCKADPPTGYAFGGYDEAIHKAAKSGKKIFVYYGREGCGFCDKTNRDAFSKAEIKQRYANHYELVYIDAEGDARLTLPSGERITEEQFGARQKVLGTPYFMFLEPDGKPIFKAPGYKTVKDFILFDNYIQGKHYKTKSLNQFSKEHAS